MNFKTLPFLQKGITFPAAWLWLVDELIPDYVKQVYSPQESWKKNPFSKSDATFFLKGMEELSDLFVYDRPFTRGNRVPYFQHPKYRSSYFLYFLPLQAAKFLTLFQVHSGALEAAWAHAIETGVFRVADLGAGPGTASFSLLLFLMNHEPWAGKELPRIEFVWCDTQETMMKEGKELLEKWVSHFPRLRGRVTIELHCTPWWKMGPVLQTPFSLVFMGHVLNESSSQMPQKGIFWQALLKGAQGGGVLFVEPAARRSAQLLSEVRDSFFEQGLLPADPSMLWGPCLHAGVCPLSQGRDWCHFSAPAQVPGKWFQFFSEKLGSQKHWLKFSYLWVASPHSPSQGAGKNWRRAVSDPMQSAGQSHVLLCEPERVRRFFLDGSRGVKRGDQLRILTT